jgi:hypothetical protein
VYDNGFVLPQRIVEGNMLFLRELIRTIAYPTGYHATIGALVSKLKGLGIHVEKVDEQEGGQAHQGLYWGVPAISA